MQVSDVPAVAATLSSAFSDGSGGRSDWSSYLQRALAADLLDLEATSLARLGGALVGASLVLRDAERGHIGATGVVLGARRLGAAQRMIGRSLEVLTGHGVTDVRLEVAEDNVRARRVYARSGLTAGRRLVTWRGRVTASATLPAEAIPIAVAVATLTQRGEADPPFGRRARSLALTLSQRQREFTALQCRAVVVVHCGGLVLALGGELDDTAAVASVLAHLCCDVARLRLPLVAERQAPSACLAGLGLAPVEAVLELRVPNASVSS